MKRRPKFGGIWLVVTVCTCGFGVLAWLCAPRHNETVSVDRWLVCTDCGTRQP